MRLLFAGTPTTALPALAALLESQRHDVVGVLTRPDAPAGRNRRLTRAPVAAAADAAGVAVFTPQRPSEPDFVRLAMDLDIDCAPVVAYGALLPRSVLDLPRFGWVNLHFSLLPAWRGAAPVAHCVLAGDEITGASTFLIEEGLDTGPVFGVTTEPVRADDTAGSLLERLSVAGAALLVATLDAIEDATISPVEQSGDGISLAPKLTADDARIDFAQPAAAIDRRIRACTPDPGPWTTFRGQRVKLGPARVCAAGPEGELSPGQLRAGRTEVLVGTATQPVALGTVQLPGKRPVPASDWARGARLAVGEGLG
ncbi:MAG: methionyl-tRNA formyltransferase [Jatrophihabitans sp.]